MNPLNAEEEEVAGVADAGNGDGEPKKGVDSVAGPDAAPKKEAEAVVPNRDPPPIVPADDDGSAPPPPVEDGVLNRDPPDAGADDGVHGVPKSEDEVAPEVGVAAAAAPKGLLPNPNAVVEEDDDEEAPPPPPKSKPVAIATAYLIKV